MGDFEKWFKDQDFYTNMRFIHGDRLFDKDGDVYRVLPVQIAYQGWNARQSEIGELKAQLECCRRENAVLLGKVGEGEKRIDKYRKLTISIRNEFDLWSNDSEFAGVIEAQIENLEALRGEHE